MKPIRIFASIRYHSLIFACLLYLLAIHPAYAQSLSLSLWPPLLEVMVQPGRTVTQVYKLTNNSDHEVLVFPQVFPFEPVGENGQIAIRLSKQVRPVNRSDLLKQENYFFSFEGGFLFNQPFPLPIGQTKELILKITIPQVAPQKDSYFTLLFSTSEIPADKESKSSSVTQIGSNILLTVSRTGLPTLSGRVVEFSCPKIIDSFSPVDFKLILENNGSSFWKPFGKIKITGILKQKGEIKLLEQNILADSSRKLTIDQFKPSLPIGPFKANLEFSLNEGEQKLFAEADFWYLPYKLVGGVLVLLIAFFALKYFKGRTLQK